MKFSRVESIEEVRNKHKKLLEKALGKLIDSIFFLKQINPIIVRLHL